MVGAHEATDALAGLPLAAATGAAWEEACARAPDRLLSDHAHCELKAASTAMRLVGRYADRTSLALALTDLAREELRHFERVHALVLARGRPLSPVGPDTYVKRLRAGTMAQAAWQATRRGPAAVAVHNDRDVLREFTQVVHHRVTQKHRNTERCSRPLCFCDVLDFCAMVSPALMVVVSLGLRGPSRRSYPSASRRPDWLLP